MKELKKIILINSIQDYAEIELDTSTHIYGANGSGKTDLLHLISSFYTGILKNPHIQDKGNSYYLPHSNSWIIFEVAASKGVFSLAFHREEAIPKAYFLNGDYEKEYFFKKEKALSWKEVKANHKKRKLHQAGPFDLDSIYWQILNGTYAGKDKSDLRRYALTTSPHAQHFPRLYINLYHKGEISFGLLKELLCAFDEVQEAKVDLEEIDKASKQLRKDLRSIRSWRAAESDFHELLKQHKNLKSLLENEEHLNNRLPFAVYQHREKREALKFSFEAAKNSLKEMESERDLSKKVHLDVLRQLYVKKGELGYKLSFAKEKSAHYEASEIQQKIQQFYELNLRKQRAELLQELNQDPKKEIDDTQAWWEASLKKEKALAKISEKALQEKETLLNQWKLAREDLEIEKASIKSFETHLEKLTKEVREIESERLQINREKLEVFTGKYSRQIQRAREESIELKLQIRLREEKSNSLQKRKDKEFEALEIDRKEKEEKVLNLLKKKREAYKILESQIANSGRAFMGWLEKNYPDWQQSVGKLLKDEVLLSPFLSPGIERINELFYGIHLELSELPESSVSLEQLQKDKDQLEKEIGRLEKGLAESQQKHAKQIDTREKYYRQKSRELKRKLQKDAYELQQLELSIKKSEAEIDKGSLRKDQQKEAALIKLSYREADVEKEIKEAVKSHRLALEKWEKQNSLLEKEELKAFKKWETNLTKEKEEILSAWEEFKNTKTKKNTADSLDPEILLWENLLKEIQHYESDKIQFIDQINKWEMEMTQLEIKISNRDAIEKLSEGEKARKFEMLKEEYEAAQQAWEKWQALDKEASQRIKNISLKADEQFEEAEEIEDLENLLPHLQKVEEEKKRQILMLRTQLRQALSYFPPENIFELEVFDPDHPEKDENQLQQLRLLIEEGKFEELLQGIHQRQSDLLATVNELFSKLHPELDETEERLRRLSEDLKKQFKGHLADESQFAIRYSNKGLFKSLTKLRAFYLKNRDQLGGSSLFNQGDKLDLNREAFEILEELDRQVQALPDKELRPFQMLELEWEVGEKKSLQNFGSLSQNTNRAIQIYLSVYLLKEILAGEKELSLHFCLDDVLDFDPEFLQSIQENLKESNIKFCSAASHQSELILSEKEVELNLPA